MKKLQPLLCLLPVVVFLVAARAETPAATTAPAAPAPAVSSASDDISGPVDPAKEAEIRKLLELTGTVKMTSQILDQMIDRFKMQNGSVSSEFWDRFEKEMNIQELVDKVIPIYAKYYSLEDLKAINAFYGTPVGQKVLAAAPQIMMESMRIGQDWGKLVANRLLTELKEEKEKESAPTPAATPVATPAPTSSTAPAPAPLQ